ncbi:MAG: toll/interleukin-1 receptor domain-containing protein, partial [Phycisphaerales bacterium]
SAFLESKGVSIVQAESTRSGYRYETWSFYLVFEDIDTLTFDNKRSVYIETHNKLSDLCNAIELECGPALFVEPNDIDLSSAVHPSYNTALAYFHNQVQEAHSSAGDDTWIREPFSMQCKGPGLLESTPGRSDLKFVVDFLQRRHRVSLDPAVVFAGFHTHYLNMRIALIPQQDLQQFQEIVVDYTRIGQSDSCTGLIAHITSHFKSHFNAWSFHSRSFDNEIGHESGRLVFVVMVQNTGSLGIGSNQDPHREVEKALEPLTGVWEEYQIEANVRHITTSRVQRKLSKARLDRGRFDVFLSHCQKDRDVANRIRLELRSAGLSCYLADEAIAYGDLFNDDILEALKDSRELCVLFTKESMESEWVKTEWGAAWALNKVITPVLHGGTKIADLPPRLQSRHAVETIGDINRYAEALKRRLDVEMLG